MTRISSKNQITIPTAALEEADLHRGDDVLVEAVKEGELIVRRGMPTLESAFGALTGLYPEGYLERLDREDTKR
jgi:AbrB family looped-hinge helix DNA binding protein